MGRAFFQVGVLFMGVAVVVSCGGRAALEAYELDDDGSAPNGASGGTGGTGGTGGNGGNGGTGATGGTPNTSNTQVSTSVSSSTGPNICDGTGQCDQCVQCALETVCQGPINACFSDPNCEQMADCVNNCNMGPGCFQMCAQGNPTGAMLYLDAIQCLICDACEFDCDGMGGPQLCNL